MPLFNFFFKRDKQLRCLIIFLCFFSSHSHGEENRISEAGRRLVAAYPDHLREVRGNTLVWKDGTEMLLDDGKGPKAFEELVETPDIEDMFAIPYPKDLPSAPQLNQDPGRIRAQAFFEKMYGKCPKGSVKDNVVTIPWLGKKGGGRITITRVNGLAKKVSALSEELEKLPSSYDVYLLPSEGGYLCRTIEGTKRVSPHAYGIAIDISIKNSDYWRRQTPQKNNVLVWQNSIPYEIIKIFEKHGFIWGGRWYHFDTMHFEYRPELLLD